MLTPAERKLIIDFIKADMDKEEEALNKVKVK